MAKDIHTMEVMSRCGLWFIALTLLTGLLLPACNRNLDRPSQAEKEQQQHQSEEPPTRAVVTKSAPPSNSDDDWSITIVMPSNSLSEAIQRTKFAIGDKTPRYDLNGVVAEVRDETIFL